MAYVSADSGRPEVYVTRFPQPGQKITVSIAGGNHPVWRRDGRELFFRAPDGTIMAAPIAATGELDIAAPVALFPTRSFLGPGGGNFYDVAPDGRFLVNVAERITSPPAMVVLNWPKTLVGRGER